MMRPLQPGDREPLHAVLTSTGVFTDDEVAIGLELIDTVITRPGQQDYVATVYEQEGQAVGYYCLGPTPATVGTFDLYWIAVDPSMHGRGIGGSLDGHAEAYVRSCRGRLIIAETSSLPRYDATRRFYHHHGYAELARIRGYYRVDDDLVVFGKYLM